MLRYLGLGCPSWWYRRHCVYEESRSLHSWQRPLLDLSQRAWSQVPSGMPKAPAAVITEIGSARASSSMPLKSPSAGGSGQELPGDFLQQGTGLFSGCTVKASSSALCIARALPQTHTGPVQ